MNTSNIEEILPLSPMQQGMLYHSLLAPDAGVYFEQTSWTLTGSLNIDTFKQAWQMVVDRHMALRAGFVWEGLDEPLQIIYRQVEVPFIYKDWSELDPAGIDGSLEQFFEEERAKGFDLSDPPLMRLALLRLKPDQFVFLWSHHHLLLDGWSQPLILADFAYFYDQLVQGARPVLRAPRPYRDYIAWLKQQDQARAEQVWRAELEGFSAPISFNFLPPAVEQDREPYRLESRMLSEKTSQALNQMAREQGITLNTIMQGIWALLLSRCTREDDIVFGATVSGRPPSLPGSESIVGLMINTLPVRIQVNPQEPAVEWLRKLQIHQVELREFEYVSLIDIQGWSQIPRGISLFDSIYVFENYPTNPLKGGKVGALEVETGPGYTRTNYPLTFAVSPGEQIGVQLGYETAQFDRSGIQQMLDHLETLLEGLIANPQAALGSLPMLSQAERERVLEIWSQNPAPVDLSVTVLDLIGVHAARTPDTPAVRYEDRCLTYTELERQSNQLAHLLLQQGFQHGQFAATLFPASPELVVAFLGIQKAGGAYLPVDPDYPPDRIRYMIEDSGVHTLVTREAYLPVIPEDLAKSLDRIVCMDSDEAAIAAQPPTRPEVEVTPDDLAYVIYTSGSTGRPKGSLLKHRGLSNLFQVQQPLIDMRPGDRSLQFFSISFDGATYGIYSPLCAGATLYLAPRETLTSPTALAELASSENLTHLFMTPSVLSLLDPRDFPTVRTVLTGGEALPVDTVRRWVGQCLVVNCYGPTETTIVATINSIREAPPPGMLRTPIGRPLANTRCYILDDNLQPVPMGIPGELYVGGLHLSVGYLNRPELTQEKFIPNPFSPGEKLYKTGDLACWLPDGSIDFLGRVDDQVKIRGFRVELGEIETILTEHPAVKQAVAAAVAGTRGDKQLAAYIVPADPENPPTPAELAGHLKPRLPGYMIPSWYVMLESIPMTPNGKIDRRRLPEPDRTGEADQAGFRAPRTPVEQGLTEIWQQVLGISRVSLDDSFFDLGGHSLLAAQLVSRVREVFQIEFPLRDLFTYPTLTAMASQIDRLIAESSGQVAEPVRPVFDGTPVPLSFAQQRLWFLEQLSPGNLFYNLPMAVRMKGQLNAEALETTLNEIVRRHASLRTRFIMKDSSPVQEILPELQISIKQIDLTAVPEAEREAEALRRAAEETQQPFDLEHGPLLRAALLQLAPDDHIALLVMHHIISDGWSMNVLLHEIRVIYTACLRGQPDPLPPLPVQYADFAVWQRNWLQGPVMEEQLAYWKDKFAGLTPMLELPTDHPRPAVQSSRGDLYSFELPEDLSQRLVELSREEGATLYMTLLTAFQVLLARYSGQEDIPVGTAIANRSRSEIEGLIGFFANTLVMRTILPEGETGSGSTFREALQQVRETALGAYAHQDMPFEMLVEALQPDRNLSHTPLFQVMFVLDSPVEESAQLPGLTLSPLRLHTGTATFDLTLSMVPSSDGISGTFEFNTDLWEKDTIRRMAENFRALLEAVTEDPEQPVWRLPVIAEEERRRLLEEWNDTAAPAPLDKCAHQLFERHARQTPDAAALIFAGPEGAQTLTYREMDRRANQLARYLRKQGVGKETLVAISTLRSIESIIGLMGVLKAGGAYLPVDPNYPADRVAFMLSDSRAPVLLTQSVLIEHLPPFEGKTICLDTGWAEIAQEPADDLSPDESPAGPENLAYVIYTSGSTGKPKGTLLEHRGLCNLAEAQRKAFDVNGSCRILQFAPFSFDASVWEMIMAMGNGAALVLAPQEIITSAPDLLRLMKEQRITHVTLPPSVLQVLPQDELPDLRVVVAAGEACPAELVARWAPGRKFFNAYGPTETTVCASMYLTSADEPGLPPIGKALPNFKLYVCDSRCQPVPIGVPGELLVGGVGLARGYLNRPEMTAEKFIESPFKPGERLYRTGDLVRFRPDGNIEFLGRIDQQVKVRGFRIELGEIEAALLEHPEIHQAVVVPGRTRGEGLYDHLVAYIVPRKPEGGLSEESGLSGEGPSSEGNTKLPLNPEEIRQFLRRDLPEYMIPSVFMMLEAMPISPAGKIDRRALPAPDQARAAQREYVAPRNETEARLAEICAALLAVDRVGIHDNFFDLGGHSLLATQFISHIREAFKIELPLRSLFEYPTIAELALEVEKLQAAAKELPEASVAAQPAITRVSRDQYRRKRSNNN